MMTPKGQQFVEHMGMAFHLAKGGTPIMAAMAMSLEDDEWNLVLAASMRLVRDIQKDDGDSASAMRQGEPR